jgi:hypothetical protein
MQFKPITAIVVLLLVVASLLVSGCSSSNPSTTNQTPTSSTATHDTLLENFLVVVKNRTYEEKNWSVKAFEVTWINSTSARLEESIFNKTANATINHVVTYMVFPTTQDATNYLNATNKTAYSLSSTQYTSGGVYQNATGHAPTVYKEYVWNEGNEFVMSQYTYHAISQSDNIIGIDTGKRIS